MIIPRLVVVKVDAVIFAAVHGRRIGKRLGVAGIAKLLRMSPRPNPQAAGIVEATLAVDQPDVGGHEVVWVVVVELI